MTPAQIANRTERAIQTLAKTTGPIVVGPWVGEVGFELLYWIPFLAWAIEYGHLDPDRLHVVSRGGAGPWYAHLTPHYHDLLEDVSVADVRANKGRVAPVKQRSVSAFDLAAIGRMATRLGVTPDVLHPSLMYRLCLAYWHGQVDMTWLSQYRRVSRYQLVVSDALSLPASFVAVKFYDSAALPHTSANRQFVRDAVLALTATTDVVVLQSAPAMDDHVDVPPVSHPQVHQVATAPLTNLATQTAILQRAKAFVGTYGGFSYLAPLLGVPSVSFYDDAHAFRADHLAIAEQSLRSVPEAGRFQTFATREGLAPIRHLEQGYQPRYPLTFQVRRGQGRRREGWLVKAVVQEASA